MYHIVQVVETSSTPRTYYAPKGTQSKSKCIMRATLLA